MWSPLSYKPFNLYVLCLFFHYFQGYKFLLGKGQDQFTKSPELDIKILYKMIHHLVTLINHSLNKSFRSPSGTWMSDAIARFGLPSTYIRFSLNEDYIHIILQKLPGQHSDP